MKKKPDFFCIAAIVLLCLSTCWMLADMLITAIPNILDHPQDIYYIFYSNYSRTMLSTLFPCLLFLIAGLIAKKNRFLLCLSTGAFAAVILSGTSSLLDSLDPRNLSFALTYLIPMVLMFLLFTVLIALPLWIMILLLRQKPLPSVLVFAPVATFLLVFLASFGFRTLSLKEHLQVLPYLFLIFGVAFSGATLSQSPHNALRKVTTRIGIVGGVLFLLANLFSLTVAILFMVLGFFNPSLSEALGGSTALQTILGLIFFLLFFFGMALIPVAFLRFGTKTAKAEKVKKETPPVEAPKKPTGALSVELQNLKALQQQALISQEDYDAKKRAILTDPHSEKSTSLQSALLELKQLQDDGLICQTDYDFKKKALLSIPLSTKTAPLPEVLRKLKHLQDEGLITPEEYNAKKAELLTQ